MYNKKLTININDFLEHLILVGLFGTLILPSLNIGIALNAITIVSLVLILLLPFLMQKQHIEVNKFLVWYSFILITIFYAINHAYIALNVKTTYRDYMEWFRYAQVLPYLLIASIINYRTFEKKLMMYLNFSVIYIIFISFLQITNIGNLGYTSGMIYSSATHVESMISHSHRIVVTGSDPNVGAVITVFILSFVFFSKENIIYKNIKIISLLIIILMTQSRTILLAILFTYSFYILFFSKINFFIKFFIVFIFIGILYSVLLFFNLEYVTSGFKTAIQGSNHSLNVRFENLLLSYERFLESIALGWGPAKSIHATVIDSEYALILQRYGLVGMFFFLGYLLSIIHLSYSFYTKKSNYKINIPLVAFSISTIGLIVMATNNFIAGYQTIAISTFIVIALLSYTNQITKDMNNAN